jgi:hypothetical protein
MPGDVKCTAALFTVWCSFTIISINTDRSYYLHISVAEGHRRTLALRQQNKYTDCREELQTQRNVLNQRAGFDRMLLMSFHPSTRAEEPITLIRHYTDPPSFFGFAAVLLSTS